MFKPLVNNLITPGLFNQFFPDGKRRTISTFTQPQGTILLYGLLFKKNLYYNLPIL
jgi:hypothetical protein